MTEGTNRHYRNLSHSYYISIQKDCVRISSGWPQLQDIDVIGKKEIMRAVMKEKCL